MALSNPYHLRDVVYRNQVSQAILMIIGVSVILLRFIVSAEIADPVSHLFYLIIFLTGLWFARKMLLLFFSDLTTAVALIILCYGTNLLYIAAFDNQWQALTLFTLYSLVLYLLAAWSESRKFSMMALLAIITGLIILFQPTGYLSLFILGLWGVHDKASLKQKMQLFHEYRRQWLWFFIILLFVVLLPVLVFRIAPGNIPFLSFRLPGVFFFGSRFAFQYLFDIDHGLFIYSPAIILAITGFYFLAEKRPHLFFAVFIYALLDLIVETSWSKLYMTAAFGQIAFIPLYAFLLLPFASLVEKIIKSKLIVRIIGALLVMGFVFFSLFQTWQFTQGILANTGMTPAWYRAVFGKTAIPDEMLERTAEMAPDRKILIDNPARFKITTLAFLDFENSEKYRGAVLEQKVKYRGRFSVALDSSHRYSPGYREKYDQFYERKALIIRVSAFIYLRNQNDAIKTNLVITSIHHDTLYNYRFLNLSLVNHLRINAWNEISLDYLLPSNPPPGDEFQINIVYDGNSVIFLDNIKVELFTKK